MDLVSEINRISPGFIWSKSFTFGNILDFTNGEINTKILRGTLLNNPNFIFLSSNPPDENKYIFKGSLFRWFFALNVSLAKEGVFKISKQKIALLMSLGLRTEGKWLNPPPKAIDWAKSMGLVASGLDENQYAFPLAGIVSLFPKFTLDVIGSDVLDDFVDNDIWCMPPSDLVGKYLKENFEALLHSLGQRTISIIQLRTGLLTGHALTLEEIGERYGITRERVRQIEQKFWRHAHHPSRRRVFLKALLCDVISSKGSLVVDSNPHNLLIRDFLAKWARIPKTTLPYTGLSVFGLSLNDFIQIGPPSWKGYDNLLDNVAKRLNSDKKLFLSGNDVNLICARIAAYRGRKWGGYPFGTEKRLYLSLRDLGKPSHYSEIARVHNYLFPNVAKTEHVIHAALGRYSNGIVWVGIKGTYALKEWGYQKPLKSLFESAAEIVQKIYLSSRNPVPFSAIVAEMGKYRRALNHSSLLFAVHLNPNIQRISSDMFIPRTNKGTPKSINSDKLDKALREFHTGRN